MTLPASGASISLSQVNTELGLSSTANISMGNSNVRTLFQVPSGAISLSNGHGKANDFIVAYTVVAGGGSGVRAGWQSGGGGAGALRHVASDVLVPGSYAVTVGAGAGNGANGSNSVFRSITSVGGGRTGITGGSGGGGQCYGQLGAAGTTGGNRGGNAEAFADGKDYVLSGGGGGGAGSVGATQNTYPIGGIGAAGGSGASDIILGVVRAGGGGGSATYIGGAGGSGGGGTGGSGAGINTSTSPGSAGAANYGGGGGGSTNVSSGGSGVVLIRYPNAGGQRGSGGSVQNTGGYYIHTFTGTGTFTVT